MNPSTLGILPRLGLALLPWLTGELINNRFYGCWGSGSPFCIYYWHPPGLDLVFALLVLAPFISARDRVVWRVLALIILSVLVHVLSVEFLVQTRGSLTIPGIDSIFVNIIPIAILASLITGILAARVCGLTLTWRLSAYAALAAMPISLAFLLSETTPVERWIRWLPDNWFWAIWHLSICTAIYYGRARTPRQGLKS